MAPRATQQECENRQAVTAPPFLNSEKTSRLTISGLLNSINDGLTDINRNVVRANAVASATSELRENINAERLVIEAALDQAKSAIDLQEKLKNPLFKEAYLSFSDAFSSLNEATHRDSGEIEKPVPNFVPNREFSDENIADEVQRVVARLRDEREAFLSAVYVKLTADRTLRENFVREVHKLNGNRYLPAIDPFSSWR